MVVDQELIPAVPPRHRSSNACSASALDNRDMEQSEPPTSHPTFAHSHQMLLSTGPQKELHGRDDNKKESFYFDIKRLKSFAAITETSGTSLTRQSSVFMN